MTKLLNGGMTKLTKHKYICDVHDEIKELVEKIRKECDKTEPDILDIDHCAYCVLDLVGDAKEMGVRMEKGLERRKEQIENLTSGILSAMRVLRDETNAYSDDTEISINNNGYDIR